MNNNNLWKFNKTSIVEEWMFNPILEDFYKAGIDGLVRENIQNSLDGKNQYINKPVEVHISMGSIKSKEIPGIDDIKDRIKSLKGGNKNTKETIEYMKKYMDQDEVSYISFEDRNTKGLSGAKRGYNYKDGDTFGIYAYQKGVHNIEKNDEIEDIRGGSHGVGKIASNAASDINLMYFSNCDENGDKHIGGTIQLIEHKYKGDNFRSTGYFTDLKNGDFYPYLNSGYNKIFEKNTRGLKIIIPFLRKSYSNKEDVIRSVCDNFFMSILNDRLIVFIDDLEINKDSIFKIINNSDIYTIQNIEEMKKNFTKLYMDTYLNEKKESIEILDKKKNLYKFDLYLKYDEKIKKGRVAVIRRIGMKIEDLTISGHSRSPFNAIIIPQSKEEDIFLKSLENESHTKITNKHIKDNDANRNALNFINNLNKEIKKHIEEKMKKENPSDGLIDTGDLIYSVENNFRKEISKKISTVELTKGKNKKKKRIIKRKTNKYEKKEEGTPDPRGRKKEGRKRDNGNGTKDIEKKSQTYTMSPELVKRILLNNREIILINLSGQPFYSNEAECNIFLKVIDGMGKEEKTRFNINEIYKTIIDKNTYNELDIIDNKMIDVSILSGEICLELQLKDNANQSLKFIYVVEV